MNKRLALVLYRLAFAALVLVAVIVQLLHGRDVAGFSTVNYFSFFTIESNVFGAVMFVVSAIALLQGKTSQKLAYLRGAATLYMVVTGLVYSLLLAGADVQTPIAWINTVLHYIFPVAILLDWILDRPAKRLSYKKALLWLVFPVVYLAYCLIRGPLAHNWYPYPFLNVTQQGYATVAVNSAVIAIAVVLLALLLTSIPRLKTKN